jgi:hypothetical protein
MRGKVLLLLSLMQCRHIQGGWRVPAKNGVNNSSTTTLRLQNDQSDLFEAQDLL